MDIDRVDDESTTASDPPDQALPKHILNVLNNDCIQEILCRLKNIKDFLSAAEVCTRFQENARQCFPPIYKVFYSTHAEDLGSKSHLVLPLNRVQSFLSIFGDFIVKIAWGHHMELFNQSVPYKGAPYRTTGRTSVENRKENYFYGVNNLRLLADYCGKTVNELQIRHRIIDLRMLHGFPALECLEIYDCMSVYDYKTASPELFSNLRSLKIAGLYSPNFDWLERTFPKLIEAEFTYIDTLEETILIEFLKRNPQLQRLYVGYICMSSSFWHAFDDTSSSSSDLRYLHINTVIWPFKCIENEIKYLGKYFSNLKYIHFNMMNGAVSYGFINLLVENNVPIEILSLEWRESVDCGEVIRKFKHIKEVRIKTRTLTDVVKICKSLPDLKWLKIYVHVTELYETEIIEALKYKKNGILSIYLYKSIFIFSETTINSNLYYRLLNLCENRVKLQIFGHKITVLVENSVLNMNEDWLQIEDMKFDSMFNSIKELPDFRFGKFCQLGKDPRCNDSKWNCTSLSITARNIPGFNSD